MIDLHEVRMSSYAWLRQPEYAGVSILDPDGWDRRNLEASMTESITHGEFQRRLILSTVQMSQEFSERMIRTARQDAARS